MGKHHDPNEEDETPTEEVEVQSLQQWWTVGRRHPHPQPVITRPLGKHHRRDET
jgi:hypothetical protein